MNESEIQVRGLDAATAYLERCGMVVEEADHAAPFDLQAQDEGTAVGIIVEVNAFGDGRAAEDMNEQVAKAHAVMAEYHEPLGEDYRVDVVSIRVYAEDRALLRHFRGEGGTSEDRDRQDPLEPAAAEG